MKASSLHAILALAAAGALAASVSPASAQDVVVLQSGASREGKVIGVSDGGLKIQAGAGSATIPLAQVKEVRMPAPPELEAAAAQLSKGNAKGAVAILEKLNANFARLPAPWVVRAAAMLGDAKLAAGDKAGAEAAYAEFAKAYPQATDLANLGRARLAVDSGNYAEAEKMVAPILSTSAKTILPDAAAGNALCQSHYIVGRAREAAGDYPAALANYLKASAVFPYDTATAADAQARADKLRSDHPGLIAP